MRKPLGIIATLLTLITLGAGCTGGGGGSGPAIKPVALEYWRMDDEPETMTAVIEEYRKVRPHVTINYRKFRRDEYEKKLLEAFAEDRGPDIFSIPNVSLLAWQGKIQPMPKEVTVPVQTVNAKKQVVTTKQKIPTLTIREIINSYVEVITNDVILSYQPDPRKPAEDRIFGLPYSADTLGLFFNSDLLKKADIEKPPATWRELQDQARLMTIKDGDDPDAPLKQSGAAIGTADNVAHYTELLSVIMMQNGTIMAEKSGYASFDQFPPDGRSGESYPPGIMSLIFYGSFANKNAPAYSWNDAMPPSLDAFIGGRTAFYFGYPYETTEIRTRAPKLNFGIAKLPQVQPSKPKNIALYPIEVVANKTANPDIAWDFLQFAAAPERVSHFLTASKRPTALRSLIGDQLNDPDIAPFASQLLTAESWYKGMDYGKVEEAFATMINTKPTYAQPDWWHIVTPAVSQINSTISF